METLAYIVEIVWRALCHDLAYPAHKIGSEWLRHLQVQEGAVLYGDHYPPTQYVAVADLDLRFAATISRRFF